MKRFVVVIDGTTADEDTRNRISTYFKNNNFAWWHWFPDVWLIIDPTRLYNSAKIRDSLRAIAPDVDQFVISVDIHGWAMRGDHKYFGWLHRNWSRKDI